MDKLNALLALDGGIDSLSSLARPQQITLALQANDRLKLYLTMLQQAERAAHAPGEPQPDLQREFVQAGFSDEEDLAWLRAWPTQAQALSDGGLRLPGWTAMAARLQRELQLMAAPVLQDLPDTDPLAQQAKHWLERLAQWPDAPLSQAQLADLTRGSPRGAHEHRPAADVGAANASLHQLIMALHKRLNALSANLGEQGADIDGAKVWALDQEGLDAARVAAFMRGLNRTRPLKLDHPGLGTCATRDRQRLLIQNDIGTNDAHVLVLQIDTTPGQALELRLTYSDLHLQRFLFFREQLEQVGANWGSLQQRQADGLNAGMAFHVGTALFKPESETELLQQLEGLGERIVFLIDWNRARKRLMGFVDKAGAVAVLKQAADQRWGHMAWLVAGGERLVWDAMAAQGPATFRLGDRLQDVLGPDAAREYLADLLECAHRVETQGLTRSLVADEARALLGRRLRQRHGEFESLDTQAGLAQALAQALADALTTPDLQPAAARKLAERAKQWERQADQLVMRARTVSERLPQWQFLVRLLERGDDVIDALEEACFIWQLVAEHAHERPRKGGTQAWGHRVHLALSACAGVILQATQDMVRALSIARHLGESSERADHDDFLASTWRVLQAERESDELHRQARAALAADWREHEDAVALRLGQELAEALEQAGDALLGLAHALRERAFHRIDAVGA